MNLPFITADDWGLSPGINEGILELARRGIVQRVSVLATGAHVTSGLAALKELPNVTPGLHFSLTFGGTRLGAAVRLLADAAGRFHASPAKVAWLWLLAGPGRRDQLAREANLIFLEQLTMLQGQGITPAYLDGHHHIHLVPGIMEALLPALGAQRLSQVRVPYDPARLLSRVGPVVLLANRARHRWPAQGLTFFPCVYPAARDYRDASRLERIVRRSGGYELVVHPAARDDVAELGIPDRYPGDRVREYQVLRSLARLCATQTGAP